MHEPIDISHMLWTFVDIVRSMAFDDISTTVEFEWLQRSIGNRYTISEDAFVPWTVARDALDSCGMCVPQGVSFIGRHYVLDDVEALFTGLGNIASAVKSNSTKGAWYGDFSRRMNDFDACVRRMKDVVSVHDLASEMKHKLR